MLSQEDYLDKLLKGLTEDTEEPADGTAELQAGDTERLVADMDETDEKMSEESALSEEEIEQMLQANSAAGPEPRQDSETSEEDLMSLLEKAGEDSDDLQDIRDMLQKADNNEAVDEDLIAMLQGIPDTAGETDSPEEVSELLGGMEENAEEELTGRRRKALEKKRLKEEKAAAKKAARDARKAEKLARKAARGKKAEASETEASEMDAPEAGLAEAGLSEAESQEAELPEVLLPETEVSDGGSTVPESVPQDIEEPIAVDMSAIDDLLNLGDEAVETFSEAAGETQSELTAEKAETRGKKKLFSRILDFLTEEEEEEPRRGTEDIPLSDENRQVLEEMDQEENGKKGKKRKKKPQKDKKGKKDTKAGEGDAGDEDEDAGDGKKGKKEKKAKKPKKEKPPREKAPVDRKNKISLRKLMPILLAGVSLLCVIMLLVNFGGDFVVKREARKAFYAEDYETCYQELYGKELNETERVMFGKSESILRIRLWMREYELFADEGAEVEALDVLIQSVNEYAGVYEYALQWNAEDDVSVIYSRILGILQDKYGLTEEQALEIAAEPDDVEYTRLVTAAAQGKGYVSRDTAPVRGKEELPDMLPEERQFPENNGGR